MLDQWGGGGGGEKIKKKKNNIYCYYQGRIGRLGGGGGGGRWSDINLEIKYMIGSEVVKEAEMFQCESF